MFFLKVELVKEHFEIHDKEMVKVTETGNILQLQYMSHKNRNSSILMLENHEYMDLRTGEIKKCLEHDDTRISHQVSLKRTFRNLRNLINSNVVNVKNCQWITLTYAENMRNVKRLYNDFEKFHKRYKYYMRSLGFEKFEYISVVEPQGRGAWHIHLLYIFNVKAPYVTNEKLRKIWSYGFVKITSLNNVDNVGAYLTAYLGDIPLDELCDILNVSEEQKKLLNGQNNDNSNGNIKVDCNGKKYIKGGRLHFYPSNMNLYRCSRGIKRPIVEEMTVEKANKKILECKAVKTYERTIKLINEENKLISLINTQYYKKR